MSIQSKGPTDPYAKLDGSMFDKIISYIPGVSTVNVIINLAQRQFSPDSTKQATPYMNYVKSKSGLRLLAEAIPFGNFAGLAQDVRDHYRAKSQYHKLSEVVPTIDDQGADLVARTGSKASGGSPTTKQPNEVVEIEMDDMAAVPLSESPILRAVNEKGEGLRSAIRTVRDKELQEAIAGGGSELDDDDDDDDVENEDDDFEMVSIAPQEEKKEVGRVSAKIDEKEIVFEVRKGSISDEEVQELKNLINKASIGDTESLYKLGMKLLDPQSRFKRREDDALHLFAFAARRQHPASILMQSALILFKHQDENGRGLAESGFSTAKWEAEKAIRKLANDNSVEAQALKLHYEKLRADAESVLKSFTSFSIDIEETLTYLIDRRVEDNLL